VLLEKAELVSAFFCPIKIKKRLILFFLMPTQSISRSHMSYYQLLYIAPLHSDLGTVFSSSLLDDKDLPVYKNNSTCRDSSIADS